MPPLPPPPIEDSFSRAATPRPLPEPDSVLRPAPIHELERRVRRMYLEALVSRSEQVAYDERIDLKQAASSPVSLLALLVTVGCTTTISVTSLLQTRYYAVYFDAE